MRLYTDVILIAVLKFWWTSMKGTRGNSVLSAGCLALNHMIVMLVFSEMGFIRRA